MSRTQTWVAAVFVVYFIAFFAAPIFPYAAFVSIPGAYKNGYTACLPGGYVGPDSNLTLQEQSCLEEYVLPPAAVWSYATPSYRAFGYGTTPFQRMEAVSTENQSAILFFDGDRLQAAEQVNSHSVEVNPISLVEFDAAPVISSDLGFINITAQIRNVGIDSILDPTIYVSMAGYSSNTTSDGVTWIHPRLLGGCPQTWGASDYCTATQVVQNNLPANRSFDYYAEIRGYHDGSYFVYRQGFSEAYPKGGVGPLWVGRFMGIVNGARTGPKMNESGSLDVFAALRFKHAASNFPISDYGFNGDVASFFGGNGTKTLVEELLLFPGRDSPSSYASFLSDHAIKHWSALTDSAFTEFGYFVGHSPYYEVELPCSVYEIPGPGINITSYFQSQGCNTLVQPGVTWLVLILSS